ncbi:MAG: transcriptional regulator [Candidatus Eisenbacteria bacterium]|nr:transcriptional regulator [Candidatus Eisenbacteria bacterium]
MSRLVIDAHLTSQARLAIIASLVPGEALTFTQLKEMTSLADGNLHVQARRLADAGYIEIAKGMRGNRSLTRFKITELGLESLRLLVRRLQAILATESGRIEPRRNRPREDSQVWM